MKIYLIFLIIILFSCAPQSNDLTQWEYPIAKDGCFASYKSEICLENLLWTKSSNGLKEWYKNISFLRCLKVGESDERIYVQGPKTYEEPLDFKGDESTIKFMSNYEFNKFMNSFDPNITYETFIKDSEEVSLGNLTMPIYLRLKFANDEYNEFLKGEFSVGDLDKILPKISINTNLENNQKENIPFLDIRSLSAGRNPMICDRNCKNYIVSPTRGTRHTIDRENLTYREYFEYYFEGSYESVDERFQCEIVAEENLVNSLQKDIQNLFDEMNLRFNNHFQLIKSAHKENIEYKEDYKKDFGKGKI